MTEIDQRWKELEITKNELVSVWMLERIKKWREIETFEYQAMRYMEKDGGENVLENFEKK